MSTCNSIKQDMAHQHKMSATISFITIYLSLILFPFRIKLTVNVSCSSLQCETNDLTSRLNKLTSHINTTLTTTSKPTAMQNNSNCHNYSQTNTNICNVSYANKHIHNNNIYSNNYKAYNDNNNIS